MFLSGNLKKLRLHKGLSQEQLAQALNIPRTTLISYEKGSIPQSDKVIQISDHFGISCDILLKENLNSKSSEEFKRIIEVDNKDLSGTKLRILSQTLNSEGKENVIIVDNKAHAGYTSGFSDPGFVGQLPVFSMPLLDEHASHRCFQVKGDSMPPVKEDQWIVGKYVQNWKNLRKGKRYIVVTQKEGIVFKRIYPNDNGLELLLVSDNPVYEPYNIHFKDINEIWEFVAYWEMNKE